MSSIIKTLREKSGGVGKLAKQLSELGKPITSQAISQWHRVPAERTLDVEKVTGIPRHELRPDLYPRDGAAA